MSTLVKVYGTLNRPDGNPVCWGSLEFVPTIAAWHDTAAAALVPAVPVGVTICPSAKGTFSVYLQATDDSGITPNTGWSYTVRQCVNGLVVKVWTGFAPHVANVTAGIDYATVAPVG